MSLYASGQKPASESKHQSPSQAQAVKDIHDSVPYWGVNGRFYTYEPNFGRAKTIFEGFVKDANSIPAIGDDRRFIGDHWVNGPEWRRSISSSSSAPFPTRPAWTSPKVQQRGPQSLSGVRNRETISKDNTVGDEARMDYLLATCGKRVMGIKHQEQYQVMFPEYVSKQFKLGWGSQHNGHVVEIYQSSERRPRVLGTNNGDSYTDHSDGEDGMLNNTSLLLVGEDYQNQGEYNGFAIPNMDGDKWINPRVSPCFTTYGEDSVPRQFNGFEIRMKKRKNNIRGKGQKSKKEEIGNQALLRAEVLTKLSRSTTLSRKSIASPIFSSPGIHKERPRKGSYIV